LEGISVLRRFYGWWVLTAATIGLALGFSNIGVASFGLFVLPLSEAFGWGRGDISVALLLVNCTLVIAAPLAGVLVDRLGVRRVLLPSIVLFAATIASLALLDRDIRLFYALYVLLTIAGIGTIPATYTRVVIAWFDRRRGLAIGIAMAGIGLGAALMPPVVQHMIDSFGWRAGYLTLAALIIGIALPTVALLLREKPEDLGQLPDGAPAHGGSHASSNMTGYEFFECLRLRAFWLMVAGFPLLGLFTSGLMSHLIPLLQDRQVSSALAAWGASLLGFALIFGRLVCGYLMDKFRATRVVIGCVLGPIIGLALLASGVGGPLAFCAVLLIGFGIGAELDFMSFLVSRYFGARAYGRTYTVMYSAFAVGSGLGSVLMGYAQQRTGSYDAALWLLCLTTTLALLPFARLGPYPVLPDTAVQRLQGTPEEMRGTA
jgi:MFS family permease